MVWLNKYPDITRGKGDEVHILINSRPVASGPFQSAIRRGYKTRLMVGRHPVAVLNLELPPSEVDVNVHPTKREVRLKNAWRILEKLERAIAFTLETVPTTRKRQEELRVLKALERLKSKWNCLEKLPLADRF